jgi:hypothetical protein
MGFPQSAKPHDDSLLLGFGQPPTGRFLEISFFIASFQSPSIFRISGSGPGGLRGFLGFAFVIFDPDCLF